MTLKKSKADNSVLFIEASSLFERTGNKNTLRPDHQQLILDTYIVREPVDHKAALVNNSEIADNEYNLSVSRYVEPEDTSEPVDIVALNAEIEQIVARQSQLREQIDEIVRDLEGADSPVFAEPVVAEEEQ